MFGQYSAWRVKLYYSKSLNRKQMPKLRLRTPRERKPRQRFTSPRQKVKSFEPLFWGLDWLSSNMLSHWRCAKKCLLTSQVIAHYFRLAVFRAWQVVEASKLWASARKRTQTWLPLVTQTPHQSTPGWPKLREERLNINLTYTKRFKNVRNRYLCLNF